MGQWVPDGKLSVANDPVTAELVRDNESDTYLAVSEVVGPQVAAVLVSNPAIAAAGAAAATAAAGTAVDAKIISAALFKDTYVRSYPGHSFVITDPNLNTSSIDIDESGYPTDNSVAMWASKQKIAFNPVDPVSGWKLPFTDPNGYIGMGIRADDTFWAPGVVTVSKTQPPDPPAGVPAIWLRPNGDGTIQIMTKGI